MRPFAALSLILVVMIVASTTRVNAQEIRDPATGNWSPVTLEFNDDNLTFKGRGNAPRLTGVAESPGLSVPEWTLQVIWETVKHLERTETQKKDLKWQILGAAAIGTGFYLLDSACSAEGKDACDADTYLGALLIGGGAVAGNNEVLDKVLLKLKTVTGETFELRYDNRQAANQVVEQLIERIGVKQQSSLRDRLRFGVAPMRDGIRGGLSLSF